MKIAIVSSFDVDCGIAKFSGCLKNQLTRKGHQVTIIPLNLQALKRNTQGDQHILEICDALSKFDCVNLQLEYGLFGTKYRYIYKRIKRILAAHKNIIVTLHTIFSLEPQLSLKSALKSRQLTKLIHYARYLKRKLFEYRLFSLIKKHGAKVLVHTQRTCQLLSNLYGINVAFHPLIFIDKQFNPIDTTARQQVRSLFKSMSIQPEDKLIGVFGFFGPHKGFDIAIRALTLLPKHYKLIIVGGFHPEAIASGSTLILETLLKRIKSDLNSRVFFLGSVPNITFYTLIKSVDFCWLPYREVHQEASGVASLCFELGEKLLLSKTLTFSALYNIYPRKNILFFEIENHFELAFKTLHYDQVKNLLETDQENSEFFTEQTQVNQYEALFNLTKSLPLQCRDKDRIYTD
jgi:glycosyltransferase involved in cell wall biosynthesis